MKFEDVIYSGIDTCMVRTPMESEKLYRDFIEGQNDNNIDEFLIKLCNNKVFREAILVASETLYNKIDDYINGKIQSKKKIEQVRISLLKYFIRMTTRTTPFGLFSSVGDIEISNGELTCIKIDRREKKARVDFEWLLNIVKDVEKDNYDKLKYSANDAVYEKGDRIVIPYTLGGDKWNPNMRNSKPVRKIIEVCRNSERTYQELAGILQEIYPNIENEKIEKFIKELIDKEVIISSIRPSLNSKDQFKDMLYIILEIEGLDELADKLQKIYRNIEKYNSLNIGEGEQFLFNIIKEMKEIAKSKVYIQVDSSFNAVKDLKSEEIDQNIKLEEKIKKLVSVIMKMSSIIPANETIYDEYKSDFMEKYGEDREVKLTEMLDDDIGIGAPHSYNNPYAYRTRVGLKNSAKENKLIDYFWDKYEEAIRNNKPIEINDDLFDIDSDEDKLKKYEFPNSMEINLICKKDNNNLLYYLGPNIGSTGAGKTFGRFSHLNLGYQDICNKINEIEKKNMPDDTIICELSYIPKNIRIANVARNCNNREYELVLFTKGTKDEDRRIHLDDIYVGIENNKFYLKSRKHNKRIKIKTNNMLNVIGDANIVRFLKEIEQDSVIDWASLPWTYIFSGSKHIPEIRYGNCILATESWILKKTDFEGLKDFDTFNKKFEEYRNSKNIPKKVYITDADNRLLFDLTNSWCKKILHKEIMKKDVTLNACEEGQNIIFDKEDNDYACEIVAPFIKEHKEHTKDNDNYERVDNTKKILDVDLNVRCKMFGSDWLYLKLYGAGEWHDNLIMYYISQFADNLLSDNKIDKYFFMRYTDPEKHIRLRFNGKNIMNNLYDITEWLRQLCELGVISRYELGCYDREIERYGGLDGIEIAEDIFYMDSRIVEKLLLYMKEEKITYSKEMIGTIMVISYMEQFGWDYDTQLEWLDKCYGRTEYKQDFNKERREYAKLCNSDNDWQNLRKDEEGSLIYELFKRRDAYVGKYRKAIQEGKITTDEGTILGSIIHLSCNRLFGTDRNLEKKIMLFARHTLYELKYVKNSKLF